MEINIREQTRQMDQEKWKLSQDDARIKALQVIHRVDCVARLSRLCSGRGGRGEDKGGRDWLQDTSSNKSRDLSLIK